MQPNHSQQGGREEGYKSYPLADTFSSLLCNQTILSREGERKVISLTSLSTSSPALYATKPFSGTERKREVINLTSLPTSFPAFYAAKPLSAGRERGRLTSYLFANKVSSLVCNQTILSREGARKIINLTSLRKVIKLTSLPTRSPALYAASHSQQGGREEGYKSYLFADMFSSLVCNQAILSREGERKTISLTSLPTSSPALYATKPFSAGWERGRL